MTFKGGATHILREWGSYNWSGQYSLLAKIIGAAHYANNNPTVFAYGALIHSANTPVLPANPTSGQIRQLTDATN